MRVLSALRHGGLVQAGLAAGLAIVGVQAAPAVAASTTTHVVYTAGHGHILPMRHAGQMPSTNSCKPSPGACHMLYYGGPVQADQKNDIVLWSSSVASYLSNTAANYYSHINNTNYLGALSEYSTVGVTPVDGGASSNQTIGAVATYEGTTTITPSVCNGNTVCTVTDAQIQQQLTSSITGAHLNAAAEDRNFTLLFPPNVIVCQNTSQCSNNAFCAYHGTFQLNGVDVVYQVQPDESAFANGLGCGPSSAANNASSALSHESVETKTDTEVGLVTTSTYSRPAAWGDNTNGEIGDPCNQQQTTLSVNGGSVVVQQWWSNKTGNCISPTGVISSGGGGLVNGSFQSGTLNGWAHSGTALITTGGDTSNDPYALQLGSASPSLTSKVSQTFVVPSGMNALYFIYWGNCVDRTGGDYLKATIKDVTAGTLETLPKTCVVSTAWTTARGTVIPGHKVTLTLINHDDDDSGGASYSFFDEVHLAAS